MDTELFFKRMSIPIMLRKLKSIRLGRYEIKELKPKRLRIMDKIYFASDEIKKEIMKYKLKRYQITYHGFKLIVVTNRLTLTHKKIINRILMLNIFFVQFDIPRTLTAYIFLTDYLKWFPRPIKNKQITITKEMVNSAQCVPGEYISIFRREECLKTCIHEYIHFIGLDHYLITYKINLNVSRNVDLRECFTETMACVFNILFYVNNIKEFERQLKKEIYFSYLQTKLLLSLNNMRLNELLEGNKQYQEETNSVSYYILKMFLLKHKEEFFANHDRIDVLLIKYLKKGLKRIDEPHVYTQNKYSGRMTMTNW